ncbi:MAG: phasin [Rhodocyclaceae bacterium]|jgi:phasin family protein|nr:MAG: phasin [Rhodocyclaceae bacterium]TND05705.1 MAG: phasin [Rhodocyclaceae bacterium]
MVSVTEQLVSANKARVETLATIADAAFSGTERLAALNVGAARSLLEDSLEGIRAALAANDVQDLVSLRNMLAEPGSGQVADYSSSVFEIAMQTRQALSRVVEARVLEMNKVFTLALHKSTRQIIEMAQANPVATAAVKSRKKAA